MEVTCGGLTPLDQSARDDMYRGERGPITERLLAAGARYSLSVAVALGELDAIPELSEQTSHFPEITRLCVQRLRREGYHDPPRRRWGDWFAAIDLLAAAGASLHPALLEAILSEDPELARTVVALGADPHALITDESTGIELALQYVDDLRGVEQGWIEPYPHTDQRRWRARRHIRRLR